MNIIRGHNHASLAFVAFVSLFGVSVVRSEIVAFNMVDKAVNYTGISPISVTNGEQILGGTDNTAAGNINNISYVAFDFNDDLPPDLPPEGDPFVYYDFQIRTGTPETGNQIVFDGFHQTFTPTLTGSYVVSHDAGELDGSGQPVWRGYNRPFTLGELIGDGVEEFTHVRTLPVPPGAPGTFSIGIDEGGITTFLDPLADNFIGFKLQSGYFGWVRVQYDDITPGGMLTLLDGAYENTGAPIAAGDTGSSVMDNADFDGNGLVDGRDFLIWQRGFGLGSQSNNANGDANGDTVVDAMDLSIWQGQYGGAPLSAITGVQVPEPVSTVLFVVGCSVALNYRCRRAARVSNF